MPRSYSCDLALQLNFIYNALDDGRMVHVVLFGFADSNIDTQMSLYP